MGVVACGCAYAGGVLFDLPVWLTVLVVWIGQVALSAVLYLVLRRCDEWLWARALPPDWPGRLDISDLVAREDVGALLVRARGMIGRLAVERFSRVAVPIRTGGQARWVGERDVFLTHLHNADAHLCGTVWLWARFGRDVAE
ncbi:hypothetical protein GCM10009682_17180 [Luedemannella flava]|uniref:Uncharacterized protein n=2 Tax=Luedemannella flava TaxID=349316 RepID=A0ABN2LSE3_9ACTN